MRNAGKYIGITLKLCPEMSDGWGFCLFEVTRGMRVQRQNLVPVGNVQIPEPHRFRLVFEKDPSFQCLQSLGLPYLKHYFTTYMHIYISIFLAELRK